MFAPIGTFLLICLTKGSPIVLKEYADALSEQAFHDPKEIDFNLLHLAILKYISLGHKDAIKELLKRLSAADNDGVANTLSLSEGNRGTSPSSPLPPPPVEF